MNINSSILRTRTKSPFWKGAVLLASLVIAASVQVKADTITNYDLVDDVIGDTYIESNTLYQTSLFGSSSISGEFTAWKIPNSSTPADLSVVGRSLSDPNIVNVGPIGYTIDTERQYNFSRNYQSSSWSVTASGAGARRRNFRIYSQKSEQDFAGFGPSALSYDNISDNGTYTEIPQVTGSSDKGFSGNVTFALEGFNLNPNPVRIVYLSLERLRDGAYWDGRKWGTSRVNHSAAAGAASSQWVSSTIWPTGGDLENGAYRLRTMAAQNGSSGNDRIIRGKLNTITFSIARTPVYYRLRNRWASSMYMYDAADIARYSTLQSSAYSQSPTSFQWELLPVSNAVGYISIKNRATGDILHVENSTGIVQCTSVPYFYTSSMWKQTEVDAGYKRFENRKQFGKYFRLGYSDGQVHYDSVPATDITAHWSLEPVAGSNAISSSAATLQSAPSGGAS